MRDFPKIVGTFLIVVPQILLSQVTLSEIMYDVPGSDAHDEFVELVNLSVTDSVDVSGWLLSDGAGTDHIIDAGGGTVIKPGQIAVVLDASYFENSSTYDAIIPDSALILTIDNLTLGKSGLSNSIAETVSVLDSNGAVITQYTYSLGNTPGFSDEKVDLRGLNSADNWQDSRVMWGTPGAPNSVSPLRHDLAIAPQQLLFEPWQPAANETVLISVTVHNKGTRAANQFSVRFFDDGNHDGGPAPDEILGEPFDFTATLAPADSVTFTLEYHDVTPGKHTIIAVVDFGLDEDVTNNQAIRTLLVRFAPRALLINEIMYSPAAGYPEWVELYNPGAEPVRIEAWRISDSDTGRQSVIAEAVVIPPAEFHVLAAGTDFSRFPDFDSGKLTVLPSFPALNNDADAFFVYDLTGLVVERVSYKQAWGGGPGISLEKINPALPAEDSTNWSSCVAFEGGTPGQRNSIFTQSLPTRTTMTIAPDPFSPDGDGVEDFALISYQLPVATAALNLKIFDLHGRLIRYLVNNGNTGSEGTVVWDGRDDRGETARIGIYVVFLQAIQASGGILESHKQTVVLAGKL